MKKRLLLCLITIFTVSCFVGCSNGESSEKETLSQVENRQISTETEVEVEEYINNVAMEPEVELAIVTVNAENSDIKMEIAYNAAMFEIDPSMEDTTAFMVTPMHQDIFYYYEDNELEMPEEYKVWWTEGGSPIFVTCKAGMTAQELYDSWSKDGSQYYSELTTTTINGEEVYSFNYLLDGNIKETYRVYEKEGNVLIAAARTNDFANVDYLCTLLFENIRVVE